jgi:hypothetical protein
MFVSPWLIEVYVYSALTTAAVLAAVPIILALVGSFGHARPRPGPARATPSAAVAQDGLSSQAAGARRRPDEADAAGVGNPGLGRSSAGRNGRPDPKFSSGGSSAGAARPRRKPRAPRDAEVPPYRSAAASRPRLHLHPLGQRRPAQPPVRPKRPRDGQQPRRRVGHEPALFPPPHPA